MLEGLLDFLVPFCKIRVKQNVNPWVTSGDITAARCCTLHPMALLSACQSDWKLFCDACIRMNALLRSAKRCDIAELASAHG